MYVLAPNQQVEKYPYSIGQLRKDNSQISFPRNPSDELLTLYNMFPVATSAQPSFDKLTHCLQEGTPELQNGAWRQVWSVRNKTPEEIAMNLSDLAKSARDSRDSLLAESDWVVAKAVEQNAQDNLGIQIPVVWLNYRQALRDLPQQDGFPVTIDWPVKP